MSLRIPSKNLFKGRYNEHILLINEVAGSYGVDAVRTVIADTLGSVQVIGGSRGITYNQMGLTNPVEVMCSDPRKTFNLIQWYKNDGTISEITISSLQDIGNARLDVKILGDIRANVASKIAPPKEYSIVRRFSELTNDVWIDSINGRNVTDILYPSSVFTSLGGNISASKDIGGIVFFKSIITPETTTENKCLFIASKTDNSAAFNVVIGADNRIYLMKGTSDIIANSTNPVSAFDSINCYYSTYTNTYDITINDVKDKAGVYFDGVVVDDEFIIGARTLEGLNPYVGTMHTVSINDLSIPLPHLFYGLDNDNELVKLDINGVLGISYNELGTNYLLKYGYSLLNGNIIPNNENKESIDGGVDIVNGSDSMLNISPIQLGLYPDGQIAYEYAVFDTSNVDIWDSQFDWNFNNIDQDFIDANVNDNYKNRLFIKINDGVITDLILYPASLSLANRVLMDKYLNS